MQNRSTHPDRLQVEPAEGSQNLDYWPLMKTQPTVGEITMTAPATMISQGFATRCARHLVF
jgi:hypothetical protein